MNIMTYNIASGGIDSKGSRIEYIIEVIKDANPDFLAIQEADNFDENDFKLSKKISSEIGLPYFVLSEGTLYDDGHCHHVVSFSKTPIKNIYAFPDLPFAHAGLCTTIDSPMGKLTLCNVHLHSTSETKRLIGVRAVIDYETKYKKGVILGDCNALSRRDHYDDLSAKEFTHYDLDHFDVTDTFSKNYVDSALHLKKDDMRTHPTIGVGHPISKTPIRIDYIFVTKPLATHLKDTRVIKTKTSEIASDHYPVTLTLE